MIPHIVGGVFALHRAQKDSLSKAVIGRYRSNVPFAGGDVAQEEQCVCTAPFMLQSFQLLHKAP